MLAQPVQFTPVVVLPLVVVILRAGVRQIVCIVVGGGFPPATTAGILAFTRRLTVGVFPSHILRVRQFVVLLPLHPAILEPDFYLPLGKDEGVGDFDATSSCQVAIVMEFLL